MGGRPRILCIDDDPDFLKALTVRLTAEGFDITATASGAEGCQAAAAGSFDLVLLDMLMPGRDGLDTYHALRSQTATRRTPVILITGMAVEGYWEALPYDTDGPAYVMGKPYDLSLLIARIAQLLTRVSGG